MGQIGASTLFHLTKESEAVNETSCSFRILYNGRSLETQPQELEICLPADSWYLFILLAFRSSFVEIKSWQPMVAPLASWGDIMNTPSDMSLLMVNSTKVCLQIFFLRFPKAVVNTTYSDGKDEASKPELNKTS
jgi:hypothetical protein